MFVQLVYGILPGISITLLKEAYGPFTHAFNLDELIVAAFFSPVEDVSAKFIPPNFEDIFVPIHV
jgi:hypothetical protein